MALDVETTEAYVAEGSDSGGGINGKLPPGLISTIVGGFDAKTWAFCHPHVFLLTYAKQYPLENGNGVVTLRHGDADVDYDVPDGSDVAALVWASGTQTLMFRETQAVDQHAFSTSVEASLGVAGVSASTSVAIADDSKVSTDATTSTALVSYCKRIYEYTRNEPGSLTVGFLQALDELPTAFDPANPGKFFDFFSKWGSHYLVKGRYGGSYTMNTVLDKTITDSMDSHSIESTIGAGFKDGVDSFSTKADIKDKTQHALKDTGEHTSINFFENGTDSDNEVKDFLNAVSLSPALLFDVTALSDDHFSPKFAPIYDLVADAARRAVLTAAWQAYLPIDRQQGVSVFAPIVNQTVEAIPSTWSVVDNGFVLLCAGTGGTEKADLSIVTRASQDANAALLASTDAVLSANPSDIDLWIQRASAILPVSSGEFCTTSFSGVPAYAASGFIGAALEFGEWTDFGPLTKTGNDGNLLIMTCTVPSDGFLVATSRPALDFASHISVQVGSGANQATVACFANNGEIHIPGITARMGDVERASMCVPVPKGAQVEITIDASDGSRPHSDYAGLRWLPMIDPDWAFGAIQPMNPGRNQALEDGFAFGVLRAGNDGNRGYLEVNTIDRAGAAEPLLSACAVHEYGKGRRICANSVMLPVSRGKSWTAVVTGTCGSPEATMYWLPLVARAG